MARGGHRVGSGRPLKEENVRREPFSCRLKRGNIEWMRQQREQTGMSAGEIVDFAIDEIQKQGITLPISQKVDDLEAGTDE